MVLEGMAEVDANVNSETTEPGENTTGEKEAIRFPEETNTSVLIVDQVFRIGLLFLLDWSFIIIF